MWESIAEVALAILVIALGLTAWWAITRDVRPEDLDDNEM